jgi:Rad3-related DNA helicase
MHYPQATRHRRRYELGGPLAVYDIEDLVKESQALHICPFHAVGDIAMEGAGLIFMTYNQMLDPLVRFAGGYEPLFKDAVVIVDEAHNLTAETREVASFVATAQQLEEMRCHFEELAVKLEGEKFPKIARRLVGAVSKLREWLLLAASRSPNAGEIKLQNSAFGEKGTLVADGVQCLALVKSCGLASVEQIDRDIADLKLLRKDLIWAGLESTAVRSGAVNELETFLWKMRFVLEGSEDYRLVVESGPKVHFICLRGAVSFAPAVRLVRSLLLMSGTLSPFDVIQHELGLNPNSSGPPSTRNVLMCQAPHHAGLQRMCTACAVATAGNVVFDSRLKQRSGMYLDAIGFAVISLSEAIPNGTVVFLPSYSLLDALITHLRTTGCLSDLESRRHVFIEQRGEGGNTIITGYRNAARAGKALLFAVMRGKAAEGIDLRDAEARGCLVVGVPFPQLAIEVQLRRQAPGGNRWYEVEAMRQVSQAAGRLLRHQHDFGAIVLLDVRYTGQEKALQMLAPWLRSLLRNLSLEMTHSALQTFFSERAETYGSAMSKKRQNLS